MVSNRNRDGILFSKPYLRVAAYCRVSSDKDEQYHSLDAQIAYYKELINTNPNWVFAGIYADHASGRSNRKMKQFQEMMQACRDGKIDLILVKSISRFGRNTLELLLTFRELREFDVDVFFELQNIHLKDQKSEILLTVYASMAQEESESKSYSISWGIRKRFMDGSSGFISRPCYGYAKDSNGKLIVIPEEAEIISKIFEMHQSGESLRRIAFVLTSNCVPTPNGGKKWHPETLRKIINNEKYRGYVRLQKTFVSDYFSGKQKLNQGELASYIVYDTHDAIIHDSARKRYTMTQQEYQSMIDSIIVSETMKPEEQNERYQLLVEFLQKNTPKELYRFRHCNERSFSAFDKDQLGFSPAYKMNDEFDGLIYFNKRIIADSLRTYFQPQNIYTLFSKLGNGVEIPAQIQCLLSPEKQNVLVETLSKLSLDQVSGLVNQFLNYATLDYDKRMQFICQVTRGQKIACLSEAIDSSAMWGYYADDSKGFALSYDLRQVSFSDYCLAPVIYSNQRLDATEYATWLFQQQIIQRILMDTNSVGLYPLLQHTIPCPDSFMSTKVLLHKASDWDHEKEWRLVFYEKGNQNIEYPSLIKKPNAVYLGKNISAIHEKILRHMACDKGIPVYKMMIDEDDPSYRLHAKQIQ